MIVEEQDIWWIRQITKLKYYLHLRHFQSAALLQGHPQSHDRDLEGIRSEALTAHKSGICIFLVFNHTFMFAVYDCVILNTTCTNGRICAGTQKILGKFQHENAQFSEKTNFKIYERTNKVDGSDNLALLKRMKSIGLVKCPL